MLQTISVPPRFFRENRYCCAGHAEPSSIERLIAFCLPSCEDLPHIRTKECVIGPYMQDNKK